MKKCLAILLSLALLLSLAACSGSSGSGGSGDSSGGSSGGGDQQQSGSSDSGDAGSGYKIGFAFYNLSNPVWAEVVDEAVSYGASLGHSVTYVDCGEDAQRQISQIENFITSGCDVIVLQPIDPASVVSIVKEAQEQGIHVLSYSTDFEGAETNLALDPVATGEALVEMVGAWIDEKYPDGAFDWVFMNIPTIELGVQEGNAVEAAMKERYPNSNLIGTAAVLTTEEGVSAAENFMQAYPDCRVYVGISAGSGVGGNEALKASVPKDEWDDYGLFSVDATEQECANIMNGEPQKGSIGLGGGREHGRAMLDLCVRVMAGEKLPRVASLPITMVVAENAKEYSTETYGTP